MEWDLFCLKYVQAPFAIQIREQSESRGLSHVEVIACQQAQPAATIQHIA
jgi:hypothetical protein